MSNGASVYEQFLRLTGFEEHEMAHYLPEFRRASEIVKLTEEDVRYSVEKQLPLMYDIELKGVRKLLGCYIKELIDLTRANDYKAAGKKIVYGILPAICTYYYALKEAAPDRIYIAFPDMFLAHSLNRPFHRKLVPFLEEAEEYGISYGCRHCALNKTRYAARRMGIIPSADVSWIWGFVCDEGPKSDEFINLACDSNWKTFVTRLPHDQPLFAVEDEDEERVAYLAAQMKEGFQAVQKELGISVTEETMKKVINRYQRYLGKLKVLNDLIATDPQPTPFLTGFLATSPTGAPFNTGLDGVEEAVDILIEELKQRVARGYGILPKGAPRLYFRSLPGGVPEVSKMFNDNGISCYSGMTSKKQSQPPTFKDPYMATAQIWLRIEGCTNIGYWAEQLIEKIGRFHADGMVFGFLDFDRWLGSGHKLMARIIQERTGLPVFYIEGDLWEDRDYRAEDLRTRIESIAAVMHMRKKQPMAAAPRNA